MEAKKVIQVGSPSDKLESLFLRIVEQARSEKIETAGAQSGGRIADFLAAQRSDSSEGSQLIEHLVRQVDQPELVAAAGGKGGESRPAAGQPDADVIRQLVANKGQAGDTPQATDAGGKPARKDTTDRNVIDNLVQPGSNEEKSGNA
jgi:hypothetical protein